MTCAELVRLVTDYLEGALPREERRRFEAHVEACRWCARHLDEVRETIRLLGTLTEDSLSTEARDDLLAAFRGWR